jgi:hypothetical protein
VLVRRRRHRAARIASARSWFDPVPGRCVISCGTTLPMQLHRRRRGRFCGHRRCSGHELFSPVWMAHRRSPCRRPPGSVRFGDPDPWRSRPRNDVTGHCCDHFGSAPAVSALTTNCTADNSKHRPEPRAGTRGDGQAGHQLRHRAGRLAVVGDLLGRLGVDPASSPQRGFVAAGYRRTTGHRTRHGGDRGGQ